MTKRWNIDGSKERTRRHVRHSIYKNMKRGRYAFDIKSNGLTVVIFWKSPDTLQEAEQAWAKNWIGEQRRADGLPEQVEIACFDTNSSLYPDPSQRIRTSEVWDEFLPWGKDCQPLDVDVIEYVNVDSLPLYLDEARKWTRK
jgi:hypothetical protein